MAHERFERAAGTWDENPDRLRNAETLASAIRRRVPMNEETTVVDYGCGTGLVSLALAPHVGRIVAIDSSPAMLAVLQGKAEERGLSNVECVQADLEHDEPPAVEADVVLSTMVLHHVTDIPRVLARLAAMLRPGGVMALADLDTEDGSFHADPSGVVHFGFDRRWLCEQLEQVGLSAPTAETANTVERERPEGIRRYTIFLVCATRP